MANPGGFSFGGGKLGGVTGFSFGGTPATATPGASTVTTQAIPVTTSAGGGFNFSAGTGAAKSSAGGGFSFGGTAQTAPSAQSTGFSLSKPPEQPSSFGFNLNQASSTATPATQLTASTQQAAPTAAVTPAAAVATAPKLGIATTVTGTSDGLAAKTTLSGFQLGGGTTTLGSTGGFKLGTSAAAATKTATTQPSIGATPGFKLGGLATSSTVSTAVAATAVTTAASLTTTTSVTQSSATAPSINTRQLEEAISKWTTELEEQEKIFLDQATQVNAWDRMLIQNGEKITQLNEDVERVKVDQQNLDHELDFILAQQRELEEMLVPLEKSVQELPAINYQQHADTEREYTYQLAENTDAQLKRMAQDLKEIIKHLNTSNSNQDSNDPIHQIGKILNAHMDSLQWVDQNTVHLQRKVDEISKLAEAQRREQERNFRLAYD